LILPFFWPEICMSVRRIYVFKEGDDWFVMSIEKLGPFPREIAEKLARGLAFAIRSSGAAVEVIFGEPEPHEPAPEAPR
jgi:hypothetical protein